MAGLDKEESITLISAGRDIFMRFGSTRIFSTALLLMFLYGLARLDFTNTLIYAIGGAIVSAATLVSLHLNAHQDRIESGAA